MRLRATHCGAMIDELRCPHYAAKVYFYHLIPKGSNCLVKSNELLPFAFTRQLCCRPSHNGSVDGLFFINVSGEVNVTAGGFMCRSTINCENWDIYDCYGSAAALQPQNVANAYFPSEYLRHSASRGSAVPPTAKNNAGEKRRENHWTVRWRHSAATMCN